MMRAYTILLSLFTFIILSASITTESVANETTVHPNRVGQVNLMDRWVVRLASDFSIIQSNIEEMIVHYNVSERTSDRLRLLEQSLRVDVMKVITAANLGDRDTVRRYLPAIARRVQQQILVLTVNKGVTRQWAAARNEAQETIVQMAQSAPETFSISYARTD